MVEKAAASLHRNAKAQARVIDDLIDVSRIVTGKLRIVLEALDVRPAVEAAVEAMRPTAERAGLELLVELPPDPCPILGDRTRLQQIVWNLLSNAVKFTPRGQVRVSLSGRGDQITLTVADTGIGMEPEFVGQIFDRFRQADSSITREHGGLGIGLAVAKELVELHGGTIEATSPGRGRGATFLVTMPRHHGAGPAEAREELTPPLVGISVLVVDDNVDTLEVLDTTLSRAGAAVRTATSGARALDLWQAAPPDVLICDLAMPQMSGFEVLARARAMDEARGRVTRAIAVTAHATVEQVSQTARAGFQMHIAKPFDTTHLVRAVHAVRDGHES
jgi:CheY-like chemotaxis protein/anti-sigma regulatory factor (Ser/Thr protein kinase)